MEANRQHLTFFIDADEFAIAILSVREIVQYAPITRVPSMPPCVLGVINLRGSVVPVIDLGLKFGFGERPVTPRTCVVVVETALEGEPCAMGLIADSVNQVIELGDGEIKPPPAFGTRVRVDYLLGMGEVGRKFVLLLDLERVLSPVELLAVASIDAAAIEMDAAPPDEGEA